MKLYNKHMWFRERRMPVRIILCKARRAGLSTGVEAIITDDTMTTPNTNSLIVANQTNPSENVLGMCTLFWRRMPEYFDFGGQRIMVRPPLPPEYNNNPPRDKLFFAEPLKSRIWVATAKSIDAYLSFGFQNMHATEAAYYADAHELFRALYPTLSTDPHSALYIESTPNGQEGKGAWFHEQCIDAAARKKTQYGEMSLVFIPWHEMTMSFAVPFESSEKRTAFEKTYTQAEKDTVRRWNVSAEQMQWRRVILSGPTFNRDEDMFDQEYPSDLATAFLVTGTSVFARRDIKRLIAASREPEWKGDIYWGETPKKNELVPIHELVRRPMFLTKGQARAQGFESHVNEGTYNNLKMWRWPKKNDRVFIAADIGGGSRTSKDGDYSCAGIFVLNELAQDELIGVWHGRINPIAFGEVLAALGWGVRYKVGEDVPAPELVPEWTGPGTATCTYIDQKNLYPALYRYQQPGVHGMPKSKHVGWESNGKTKPYAVGSMLFMVERELLDIPDEDIVLQMASYRKKDDFGDVGSYGGAAGRHDDLVSMTQIGCAVLRLRAATVPGDADVQVIDLEDDDGGRELPNFDPFVHEDPFEMGFSARDVDEEGLEQTLFWSDGNAW